MASMHCVFELDVHGLQFGSFVVQFDPFSAWATKPSIWQPGRVVALAQSMSAVAFAAPWGPPKFLSFVSWNGFTHPLFTGSGTHGTAPGLPASPGMAAAPGNVPKY